VFPSSWATIDYDKFVASQNLYSETGMYALVPNYGGIRRVDEKVTSAYFQADLKTVIGGLPVRGDVGFRFAQTELQSRGYQIGLAPQQVTAENKLSRRAAVAEHLGRLPARPGAALLGRQGRLAARPGLPDPGRQPEPDRHAVDHLGQPRAGADPRQHGRPGSRMVLRPGRHPGRRACSTRTSRPTFRTSPSR
jgi:hypothetical protein